MLSCIVSSKLACVMLTKNCTFVLCIVSFVLSAREFQNLHVAHILAIDRQANGGAHLVESVHAGSARIDGQELIDGVELHLEDVRVARDEEFGS